MGTPLVIITGFMANGVVQSLAEYQVLVERPSFFFYCNNPVQMGFNLKKLSEVITLSP
jgi:hypothetical protein